MDVGTPFNVTERTGEMFTVSQAKEACQSCGHEVKPGYLAAVATDFNDMRNGNILVCQACKEVWRQERDMHNRIAAAFKESSYPLGMTRRTVIQL